MIFFSIFTIVNQTEKNVEKALGFSKQDMEKPCFISTDPMAYCIGNLQIFY